MLLAWPNPALRAAPARPNIVFVVADQWRAQAFGFAGDPNVHTPNLDRFASHAVRFVNAISTLPVCSPTRASLLTGQRALTHGVFINDVPLDPGANTMPKMLHAAGYDTACIGKWHVDGHGRSAFIPRERRQGFDYWKVLECTHDYNRSAYYADDSERRAWEGYDALAQTQDACDYLRTRRDATKPFLLWLAWGPPHDPYLTAPPEYRALYSADRLQLRPNVPSPAPASLRTNLAGYYAHCAALDSAFGKLWQTLRDTGLADNTILVFTSDHGDMLGSQGMMKKQKPYDEAIRVPLLIDWPQGLGHQPRALEAPIATEDLLPTLLGLCRVPIPRTVEGLDYSRCLRGGRAPGDGAAVMMCVTPFGEWERRNGGREYRGLRTASHTYVRDLRGPWLLFDDRSDPYQTNNLVNQPQSAKLQRQLDRQLRRKLTARGDDFLAGPEYLRRWHYQVDPNGTMPYKN